MEMYTRASTPPGPTAPLYCESRTHGCAGFAVQPHSLVPRENTSKYRVAAPYGSMGGTARLLAELVWYLSSPCTVALRPSTPTPTSPPREAKAVCTYVMAGSVFRIGCCQ